MLNQCRSKFQRLAEPINQWSHSVGKCCMCERGNVKGWRAVASKLKPWIYSCTCHSRPPVSQPLLSSEQCNACSGDWRRWWVHAVHIHTAVSTLVKKQSTFLTYLLRPSEVIDRQKKGSFRGAIPQPLDPIYQGVQLFANSFSAVNHRHRCIFARCSFAIAMGVSSPREAGPCCGLRWLLLAFGNETRQDAGDIFSGGRGGDSGGGIREH